MSQHQRQKIRQAVMNRVVAANTACGSRVFTNRMQDLWSVELPCILVYTEREPAEISIEAPREYLRNLEVNLEVVAKADDSLDDVIDSICADLEQAIFSGDETFGDLVVDTMLQDTNMVIVDNGEKPVGAAKITLLMPYRSSLPAMGTVPTNDLRTTDFQIGTNPLGQPELSEDRLNTSK